MTTDRDTEEKAKARGRQVVAQVAQANAALSRGDDPRAVSAQWAEVEQQAHAIQEYLDDAAVNAGKDDDQIKEADVRNAGVETVLKAAEANLDNLRRAAERQKKGSALTVQDQAKTSAELPGADEGVVDLVAGLKALRTMVGPSFEFNAEAKRKADGSVSHVDITIKASATAKPLKIAAYGSTCFVDADGDGYNEKTFLVKDVLETVGKQAARGMTMKGV